MLVDADAKRVLRHAWQIRSTALGQLLAQALQHGRRFGYRRARAQHAELLAVEAPEQILCAKIALDKRRKVRQYRVTGCMAVSIVDQFETVDVDDGERD